MPSAWPTSAQAAEACLQRLRRQNATWASLARHQWMFGEPAPDPMGIITRAAAEALGVAEVGVWLHDGRRSALVALDHYERAADRHAHDRRVMLEAVDGERAPGKIERALAVEDVAGDPWAGGIAGIWTDPPRIASALFAPIRRETGVVGLVGLGHQGARRAWHPDEVGFATALADFIAATLETEEHRRAERDLQQASEFQQQIIDTAATAIYQTDAQGHIQGVNEAFCAVTGYLPEEITGRPDSVLGEGACGEGCRLRTQASAERVLRHRCRLLDKQGRSLEVIKNASVIRHGDEHVSGTLVSFADVTQIVEAQRRLEVALQEAETARREAETANQAKSRFLANMSHEIRTPMNAILGMTDMVMEGALSDGQREQLDLAQSSAESLLGLLNDILDLAKIEAGRLELEPIEFSLRATVAAGLRPLGLRAKRKGLDFRWTIDDAVPEALVGDPTRLRQILINLVGNAVKFTERGSVEVRMQVESAGERDLQLSVSVVDTGVGIPADRLDTVFEPFTQADGSTTRRYGGTGLGTTIARQLIELMGGQIGVESTVGVGSTFHFTVRLEVPDAARSAGPHGARDASGALLGTPTAARTVLLAEGDSVSRKLLTRMLERKGWQVRPVTDGEMLLSALQREPCDVVLMDLRLPGLGGLEVIRRIRAREASPEEGTPIVVMTADAEPPERMSLAELGIQALAAKPIDRQELQGALERAWAARTAQRLAA